MGTKRPLLLGKTWQQPIETRLLGNCLHYQNLCIISNMGRLCKAGQAHPPSALGSQLHLPWSSLPWPWLWNDWLSHFSVLLPPWACGPQIS